MARLFVLIGGLIVAALMAALIGPYFIDWTSYRADFEREVSRILGREVTVEGIANARLLPFPSVTFYGIEVAESRSGEPALTAARFSMDLELAPFLRGEILVFDARLEAPRLVVSLDEEGRFDWTMHARSPVDPHQIRVERITVTRGEIVLRHAASGTERHITDLDAQLSARTLAGPWRMDGTLRLDGRPLTVSAATGAYTPGEGLRLRVGLQPQDTPIAIEGDGLLRLDGEAAVYAGQFRLESRQPPVTPRDDQPFVVRVEEPVAPLDYRVSGRFTLDHRMFDLHEFRIETGERSDPYHAEGSAHIAFGPEARFMIRAEGQQVRLDSAEQTTRPQSFDRRLAAFAALLGQLPRPAIPGTVDLRLPAIIAGGTTIRQLTLSAEPDPDGWRIGAFSAELPGRTTLEASGVLVTGEAPAFRGQMLMAIRQPSGFASWLVDDVDEAIRRLPSAGLAARVDLSSGRQSFRDLELVLGGATFRGEIDHITAGLSRPSMLLRLDGGALDLDGLLAFASLFVDGEGVTRLGDHDLDFDIKAGPVTAAGIRIGELDMALRFKGGRLDIDRLSIADLAGATIGATGRVQGLAGATPSGNLDIGIVAADLGPLAQLAAERLAPPGLAARVRHQLEIDPGLLSEAKLNLVATAAVNRDGSNGFAVSANGTAGDSRFSAAGSATMADGRFTGPLSLSLSLGNPDAARVLALFGLPALPVGLAGAGDATITLRGDPATGMAVESSLHADGLRARFIGNARKGAEDRLAVSGRAEFDADDLGSWLVIAGVPVSGTDWNIPVALASDITFDADVLRLAGLGGTVSGQALEGDVAVDLSGETPAISGRLVAAAIDATPLVAHLFGPEALTGGEFAIRDAPAFTAEVDLETERLWTGFGPELTAARGHVSLRDDGLRLSGFEAGWKDGRLSGSLDLLGNGDNAMLTAQIAGAGLHFATGKGDLSVTAAGTGSVSLAGNGRTLDELLASLSGSGSVSLDRVTIEGIDGSAFQRIVAEADRLGREMNEDAIRAMTRRLMEQGRFAGEDVAFAFTVAGGVLRAPSFQIAGPAATLRASFQLDLARAEIVGDGDLVFAAGAQEVAGAEPTLTLHVKGPVDAPRATHDAGPLLRYLTQRALELEQRRVEAMQARLLERQRLRRELRGFDPRALEKVVPQPDVTEEEGEAEEAAAAALPAAAVQEGSPQPAPVVARPDAPADDAPVAGEAPADGRDNDAERIRDAERIWDEAPIPTARPDPGDLVEDDGPLVLVPPPAVQRPVVVRPAPPPQRRESEGGFWRRLFGGN